MEEIHIDIYGPRSEGPWRPKPTGLLPRSPTTQTHIFYIYICRGPATTDHSRFGRTPPPTPPVILGLVQVVGAGPSLALRCCRLLLEAGTMVKKDIGRNRSTRLTYLSRWL